MYGRMYPEKIRPFVNETFQAVLKEWNSNPRKGKDGRPVKTPKRVTSWGVVARQLYAKESEDVKTLVKKATDEHAKNVDISKEAFDPEEDDKQRLLKLQK